MVLLAKSAVTGLCFWYLVQKIDISQIAMAASMARIGWAGLAVITLVGQTVLVGLRWSKIVDTLLRNRTAVARMPMLAITMIVFFFAQVMPGVASETLRVWMLTDLGPTWRQGLASVIIDRAIGIATLLIVGLIALVLPSELGASMPARAALIATFAILLFAGIVGLLLVPYLAPILDRFRYTVWVGRLAHAAKGVIVGAPASMPISALAIAGQLLSVGSIWLLGRSLDLPLSITDAGVLFAVIFGAILLPITISGWGLREVAVTALLGSEGVPIEQSLVFSVCFGLSLLVAALPGALFWLLYAPAGLRRRAIRN